MRDYTEEELSLNQRSILKSLPEEERREKRLILYPEVFSDWDSLSDRQKKEKFCLFEPDHAIFMEVKKSGCWFYLVLCASLWAILSFIGLFLGITTQTGWVLASLKITFIVWFFRRPSASDSQMECMRWFLLPEDEELISQIKKEREEDE